LTTGCIVFTNIQPVVQIQDTAGCQTGLYIQTFNRLSNRFENRFDNRLYCV